MVSNINECMEISQCWKKTTASLNSWSSYLLKDDLIIKKDYVSLLFPCYSGKPERVYDGKLCVCVYTKIHCYILKVGTRISQKPYTEAFCHALLKLQHFPVLPLTAVRNAAMNLLSSHCHFVQHSDVPCIHGEQQIQHAYN